jgi:hypothetical protein
MVCPLVKVSSTPCRAPHRFGSAATGAEAGAAVTHDVCQATCCRWFPKSCRPFLKSVQRRFESDWGHLIGAGRGLNRSGQAVAGWVPLRNPAGVSDTAQRHSKRCGRTETVGGRWDN